MKNSHWVLWWPIVAAICFWLVSIALGGLVLIPSHG